MSLQNGLWAQGLYAPKASVRQRQTDIHYVLPRTQMFPCSSQMTTTQTTLGFSTGSSFFALALQRAACWVPVFVGASTGASAQDWCCSHFQRGCAPEVTTTLLPYDCSPAVTRLPARFGCRRPRSSESAETRVGEGTCGLAKFDGNQQA